MHHFNTLDQRNNRAHLSHVALLASLKILKNLENGNIGSTFCVHLHGGCIFLLYLHYFSGLLENVAFEYVNHPFHVTLIHIPNFKCLEKSTSILVNALVGNFTLLYIFTKLYLYPNGYGIVVIVSFMFATIICYIVTWVYVPWHKLAVT